MYINLNVVTFNAGIGFGDNLRAKNDPELAPQLNKAIKDFKPDPHTGRFTPEQYIKIENLQNGVKARIQEEKEIIVAEKLSKIADVILIQEAIVNTKDAERVFISKLKSLGYTIVSSDRENASTAIAIKNTLIKSVLNQSYTVDFPKDFTEADRRIEQNKAYGQDVAQAVVTLCTDHKVVFTSAHNPGFELVKAGKLPKGDRDTLKNQQRGNEYLTKVADSAAKTDAVARVIGADMNNDRNNYDVQFKLLENKGFKVREPNQTTNINPYEDFKERKLDYIMGTHDSKLKKVWKAFSSLFSTSNTVTLSPATVLPGFEIEGDGVGNDSISDHKPVISVLTITERPSLWKRVKSYF